MSTSTSSTTAPSTTTVVRLPHCALRAAFTKAKVGDAHQSTAPPARVTAGGH